MKLATSTGDFSFYVPTVAEKVRAFKGLKFKNINLEQTGNIPEFFSDNDADYLRLAEDFAAAKDYAGVEYVVSHAPCLHNPIMNAFDNPDDEEYRRNIRAIRSTAIIFTPILARTFRSFNVLPTQVLGAGTSRMPYSEESSI